MIEKGKIIGKTITRSLYVDGKYISAYRSQQIRNHSPDGFAWGYGGSGPAQTALAIMLELTDEKTAKRIYHEFKWEYLSKLKPSQDFSIDIAEVKRWIAIAN